MKVTKKIPDNVRKEKIPELKSPAIRSRIQREQECISEMEPCRKNKSQRDEELGGEGVRVDEGKAALTHNASQVFSQASPPRNTSAVQEHQAQTETDDVLHLDVYKKTTASPPRLPLFPH